VLYSRYTVPFAAMLEKFSFAAGWIV